MKKVLSLDKVGPYQRPVSMPGGFRSPKTPAVEGGRYRVDVRDVTDLTGWTDLTDRTDQSDSSDQLCQGPRLVGYPYSRGR
jgi:hypothetical protein